MGQKRTFALQNIMSALPPIATTKTDSRGRSCPLNPRKRTFAVQPSCLLWTKADSCTAAKRSLFNHLVDDGEDAGRDGEAECPCGREVDNELKFTRLHHRQVSGLGSLKDAAAIGAD